MRSDGREFTSTSTVTVVHRQSFPQVPPELLLKEHAGNFRLTNLTLASLLEIVSPKVNIVLPPDFSSTDEIGRAGDEFVRSLLKEAALRPPVPLEKIKRPPVDSQNRGQDTAETKRHAKTTPPLGPTNASGGEAPLKEGSFVFQSVVPSHLSAFSFIRMTSSCHCTNTKPGGQEDPQNKKNCPLCTGLASRNYQTEEREILWGYNTGAVVHVTLRSYAVDLKILREHKTLPPRRRQVSADIMRANEIEENAVNTFDDSFFTADRHDVSEMESSGVLQGESAALQTTTTRPPRGVSLLGYYPTGGVCSLVYDAHTDLAISGGSEGTILVWDVHQRYRTALQKKYVEDEGMRSSRGPQQFAMYVYTRRLTQRIRHAHDGAISSLATHCELVLSGGIDGLVKIWSTVGSANLSTPGAPPEYAEQQSVNCYGWVRQIWCAPERNVQGEDMWVTCENGDIIGFKGSTLSQQPVFSSFRGRSSMLLECLCKAGDRPLSLSPNPTKWSPRSDSGSAGGNNVSKRTLGSPRTKYSEKNALKRLRMGEIFRAMRITRKFQVVSEEARLASTHGSGFCLKEESTSAITSLIPLAERNLFITVGYSPIVRFLDMTRLSVTAVVEHPSLNARNTETLCGNPLSTSPKNSSDQPKVQLDDSKVNKCKNRLAVGGIKGEKGLRFTDVLYITSHDYLLLLDNRNTVFVWDNANNVFCASWTIPELSDCGRPNTALRLLPCGTRHYDGSKAYNLQRAPDSSSYEPKQSSSRQLNQPGAMEIFLEAEETPGVAKIPFFLACSLSLEFCEVVIEMHTRINFQAHQDTIVGVFLPHFSTFSPSCVSEEERSSASPDSPVFDSLTSMARMNQSLVRSLTRSLYNKMPARLIGVNPCSDFGEETLNDSFSDWRREYLKRENSSHQVCVVSCSVDGDICFWGHSFKLLRVYHYKQLKTKDTSVCTIITHKPQFFDNVTSAFDAPPLKVRHKKDDTVLELQNSGSDDITSFYFSSRWQLALTGHDDGSIRFWPSDRQVATCVWHRGAHRNAVSGFVEANIMGDDKRQLTRARFGSVLDLVAKIRPTELLATISFDGHLAVWEYVDRKEFYLRDGTRVSHNELLCVAFDDMNELFVVGDSGGVISSWQARNLVPRRCVPSRPPSPWRPQALSRAPKPHRLREGRRTLLVAQRHGNGVERQGEVRRIGHTEAVAALFANGSSVFSGGEDGRVFLWDMNIGCLVREYFLLHDARETVEHCDLLRAESTFCASETHGNMGSCCLMSSCYKMMNTAVRHPENVTFITWIKQRPGHFLVSTREGWLYHFEESQVYPRSVYKHDSAVMCMCVLQEGDAPDKQPVFGDDSGKNVGVSSSLGAALAFRVLIGDETGRIAVIQEAYFVPVA